MRYATTCPRTYHLRPRTDLAVLMLGSRYDVTWCTFCGEVLAQAKTGPSRPAAALATAGGMDAPGYRLDTTEAVMEYIGLPMRPPWYRRLAAWWVR